METTQTKKLILKETSRALRYGISWLKMNLPTPEYKNIPTHLRRKRMSMTACSCDSPISLASSRMLCSLGHALSLSLILLAHSKPRLKVRLTTKITQISRKKGLRYL